MTNPIASADPFDTAVRAAYARIAEEFPEIILEGRELLLSIMVYNFRPVVADLQRTINDVTLVLDNASVPTCDKGGAGVEWPLGKRVAWLRDRKEGAK